MSKSIIQPHIENLAEAIARAVCEGNGPIQPQKAAQDEDIILRPMKADSSFNARIEQMQGRFLIFYNANTDLTWGRIRFSIAHELGHYYIEDHRRYLLAGGTPHNSVAAFGSNTKWEREADAFAAGFLLPVFLVSPIVNKQAPEIGVIRRIGNRFGTSLTCTAIRYARVSHYPCAVVVSDGDSVAFAIASDSMREAGLRYIPPGQNVPMECGTRRTVEARGKNDGLIDSYLWFQTAENDMEVYEQCIPLGRTGRFLTLLTIEEYELKDY